ncbi:hypothetical protein H5410_020203 [Solanum commersonii]|uniref:Uncharacterized protein n=1 Tax=Solanum commersonii TaxID=4109 RepID=A0A9J5Z8D9_SOLCO|nr:hypothetical protein H5410_020203 [Solanum commersonii]
MRSSSRTSFTEEAIAPQRRDPPPYTARRLNDMRDVDDAQEYGHPRSLSSRRSPPDQVFARTSRPRIEILDHQERADGDGYFDVPIHTGRFPELHSGKRRKYGERQMRNVKEQEGGLKRIFACSRPNSSCQPNNNLKYEFVNEKGAVGLQWARYQIKKQKQTGLIPFCQSSDFDCSTEESNPRKVLPRLPRSTFPDLCRRAGCIDEMGKLNSCSLAPTTCFPLSPLEPITEAELEVRAASSASLLFKDGESNEGFTVPRIRQLGVVFESTKEET